MADSTAALTLPRPQHEPRRVHPEDWSHDRIEAYWNYLRKQQRFRDLYFSRLFGNGIVDLLNLTGRLTGRMLDVGCGPGFFLSSLGSARPDLECWGIDSATDSIKEANARLEGQRFWRGAYRPDDSAIQDKAGYFDVVTCIEVVEHLNDPDLRQVLSAIHRFLRPGGIALFTTPFEEDLDRSMQYCPFCDAEFHWMQHVRSFSTSGLSNVLEAIGFRVLLCRDLNLDKFQMPYARLLQTTGWGSLKRFAADHVARWGDRITPRRFPDGREFRRKLVPGEHLCAIVER